MRRRRGAFNVVYLVLCEWMLGLMFGYFFLASWDEAMISESQTKLLDAGLMAVFMVGCFAAGYGLIRRRWWAWMAALMLGLIVFGLGVFFISESNRPTSYARAESGLAFGAGLVLLVPSALGLMMLFMPATRAYLSRRRAVREYEEPIRTALPGRVLEGSR